MKVFYEFESFRIDEEKRLLWKYGETVAIKPKTFDTLLVLIKHNREVISKDDLINEIWNGSAVSDDSLTQQISLLRKLLDDSADEHKYIVTVPGIGYKFVADVRESATGNGNGIPPNSLINALQNKEENHENQEPKNNGFQLNKRPLMFAFVSFLLLGLTAAFVWREFKASEKPTALGVKKIAVLPFKAVSDDTATKSLTRGMNDALTSRLTRIEEIVVLPPSVSAGYEQSGLSAPAFGKKIGADAVLDGQVQYNGEKIRVIVQLVGTADEKILWSEVFLNDFADVFDVQHTIAYKIAEAFSMEISDDERRALIKRYTTSAEAYRLYLDARYLWENRSGNEGQLIAKKNYERAIELDPNFALAYVGLANLLINKPSKENYRQIEILANSALTIDQNLGEAYEILGFALWRGDWSWTEAEENFRRGIELSPKYEDNYLSMALLLTGQGKFDEARRFVTNPHILSTTRTDSYVLGIEYFARNFDKVIEKGEPMLAESSNSIGILSYLTVAYAEKGDYEKALETAEKYAALDKLAGTGGLIYVANAHIKAGNTDLGREILHCVIAVNPSETAQINGGLAMLYGELGDKNKAFEHLEKSIENREWWAFTLKVAPYYDSLRDDPRFDEMLRRINLAD